MLQAHARPSPHPLTARPGPGQRHVAAYIGGLDLAAGRYDTPRHLLFDGLDAQFAGDVQNPSCAGFDPAKGGPREPWHDIHCRCVVVGHVVAGVHDWCELSQQHCCTRRCLNAAAHVCDQVCLNAAARVWYTSLRQSCCCCCSCVCTPTYLHACTIVNASLTTLHSIHGPTAYDVLSSFEARWWRQVGLKTVHQRTRRLVDIRRLPDMWLPPEDAPPPGPGLSMSTVALATPPRPRTLVRGLSASLAPRFLPPVAAPVQHAEDAWTVQLFRSIDNHASAGMPRRNADALRLGLHTLKGRVYDCSLHEAYVWAIRSAQHYIYIENQYFIGSSQAWAKVRPGWWLW